MDQNSLIAREVALVRNLTELSAKRAESEIQVTTGHATRTQSAQHEYQDATAGIARRAQLERTAIETEYHQTLRQANAKAENDLGSIRDTYDKARKRVARLAQTAVEAAKTKREEAKWEALALFESAGDAAKKQLEDHQSEFTAENQVYDEVSPQSFNWLKQQKAKLPESVRDLGEETPLAAFKSRVETIEQLLEKVGKQPIPKLVQISNYTGIVVLLVGLSAGAGLGLSGTPVGIGIGAGVGLLLAIGGLFPLLALAKKNRSSRSSSRSPKPRSRPPLYVIKLAIGSA